TGGRGSRFVITGSATPVGLLRLTPTEFRTDQTPLGTLFVVNIPLPGSPHTANSATPILRPPRIALFIAARSAFIQSCRDG
ncbi:MAG: hypothetical protein ACK5U8_14130, partial [Deltaproteobacteria bacterium]